MYRILLKPIQEKLPKGTVPLFFLLYADESNMGSFGDDKGYPVIARCLNLPWFIRNSNGTGGGRIIGWLPVVCPYCLHLLYC